MKIKGKIAIWFWSIVIVSNGFILYELFFSPDSVMVLLITLFTIDIIFLPILIRNYVLIEGHELHLYFGFSKDTIDILDIKQIHNTHNPVASSAASLDRLYIRGNQSDMIVSVVDKQTLLSELLKINPGIEIIQ